MATLITGAAGFIGFHVAKRLLEKGEEVIGVDDLNGYYPVALKQARLGLLEQGSGFQFVQADIVDFDALRYAALGTSRILHSYASMRAPAPYTAHVPS